MYDMPTSQEPMLTVRVSQDLADKLRAEAAETGRSVSDLVRSALRPKLETEAAQDDAITIDLEWPSGVYSLGPSHPSAAAVGVIVKFLDADNDWQQRDLLVLKDGITGFVDIVDRTVAPVTTRDQAERYGAAWLRQ